MTRLSRARAVASGRATCPVTPVTTMVLPCNLSGLMGPFVLATLRRVHLFAAFLGGELASGRMGEDHEVVFVVAEDVESARRAAKAKWGGGGRPHVDALTRLDMIDGFAVRSSRVARATPPRRRATTDPTAHTPLSGSDRR